jgi:hypothetical protein
MLGIIEGNDQNFRGDLCPYIFIGFRIIICMEVHPCAAKAGPSIKEVDSFN